MPRRAPIELPTAHFMAFAPLDAWARLLFFPPARVPPRYWLRLAFGLFTSALGTVITLPERLVLAPLLAWRARRSKATLNHAPGTVVVLGYFRSGTTHLHYPLSCDPQFRTPRWCETLAPQGFLLSWSFLRVFMIPFISQTRPQDDVAIGPEWPAEDEFALNNWTLAARLAGRLVLPRMHAHYDRFHSLEGLTPREYRRWRRTQWAVLWKLAVLAGRRSLLLKSPSHTGRIRELTDLCAGNVRFIHISRDPAAVVRSNVAMTARLRHYNLQDPAEENLEGHLTREYLDTERRYLAQARALPPDRLATIRYEDLTADPLGELRRVYAQLGLACTPSFERAATRYLVSVSDYKASSAPRKPLTGELAELARTFGHDRPPIPAGPPLAAAPELRRRPALAMSAALFAMLLCVALWIAQAWVLRDTHKWLVWPAGVVIGLTTLRTARGGSAALGMWAAGLTVLSLLLMVVPGVFVSEYAIRPRGTVDSPWGVPMRDWAWYHILKSSRVRLFATSNTFWLLMGAITAYRFASRPSAHAPGG